MCHSGRVVVAKSGPRINANIIEGQQAGFLSQFSNYYRSDIKEIASHPPLQHQPHSSQTSVFFADVFFKNPFTMAP